VTPSMGDTRLKKWLNLQRTLDNMMSEDGSCDETRATKFLRVKTVSDKVI